MKKKLQKGIAFILAMLCMTSFPILASAQENSLSGYCGESVQWEFIEETGELIISGTGEMDDYHNSTPPWQSLRLQIQSVTICDGVTSIGNSAFKDCYNLEKATIPDGVISIGTYAFKNCAITYVKIPEGVTTIYENAFVGCRLLEEIIFPESIQRIDRINFDQAGDRFNTVWCFPFSRDEFLNRDLGYEPYLTAYDYGAISGSVESHGTGECGSWEFDPESKTLTMRGHNGVLYLNRYQNGNRSLQGLRHDVEKVVIEGEVRNFLVSFKGFTAIESIDLSALPGTIIEPMSFSGCTNLKEVKLPAKLECLTGNLFENCTSLKQINIPESARILNKEIFKGCTALENITIPEKVTIIRAGCFSGCTSLKSITIPEGVTSIDDYTFLDCTSLKNVTIPDSVTSIGNRAFKNCISLETIKLTKGITELSTEIFSGCTSLKTVEIPDGVTSIQSGAFKDCTSLEKMEVPDSVLSIGDKAFYGCLALDEIKLSKNTEKICSKAFEKCKSLKTIYIPLSVKYIGESIFYDSSEKVVYYEGSAEQWSEIEFHQYSDVFSWDIIYLNDVP